MLCRLWVDCFGLGGFACWVVVCFSCLVVLLFDFL